ncbi:MAG: sigma 54-interacting transcriptional regulator, partial [Pyrinomonadaceae bacterium]
LLRAGALTGWIGSTKQIEGSQEIAKNLISESITIFEALQEKEKAAEGLADLAYCYWREGAFDEARVMLRDALSRFGDTESEQKAVALLRVTVVENSATRFNDSLRALNEAAPIIESSSNHTLKGRFHVQLATALKNLGVSENREDYIDRALIEYAAASFHFEQAGHTQYRARVENNLGMLFLTAAKFTEAHEHLDRARQLFVSLKDNGSIAQLDETRARAFLAQGRNSEAERVIRSAVRTLEQGGERALLAEALTTQGTALARLGSYNQARLTLYRAVEVAHQAGDPEGAGLAALTIIEELGEYLPLDDLREAYHRADSLLTDSQHLKTLSRLRSCARRFIDAEQTRSVEFSTPNFIYASEQTGALLRDAHRIAGANGAVLITGETGTGKEVLARLIHQWSGRAGDMVAINCAALPENLIESQLFGHRRGSFTDAIADYPGAVREAVGGTLFLDEIGELSGAFQAKLLRLIENGEIHTIGAPTPDRVDVRIIAATNRSLKEWVRRGRFREDLFYRLNTFHLEIPPLRERTEDIPAIAEHFIKEMLERHRKRVTFSPEVIAAMRLLPLKGNARELRSLIERTILTAKNGTTITLEAVETVALRQTHHVGFADPWANFSLKEEVRQLEDRFIELALKHTKGMVTRAAKLLGFKHHETLRYRLEHKNKNLQPARKPASPRKRSIIRR